MVGGNVNGTASVEDGIEVPRKIKTMLSDSTVPLLCTYPNELKAEAQRNIHTCMFMAALFTIAKRWKKFSVGRRVNGHIKCGVITPWNVFYSALRNSDTRYHMDGP